MSMATMVMIAGRKRDSRGRYMDSDDGAEMRSERGNNQYTRERRNDTGDYRMDGNAPMDGGMNYNRHMGGDEMRYRDGRRNEDRPGMMDRPDMRDRPDMQDRPGMRGEGWVTWDSADRQPAWEPPHRYGSPDGGERGNITDMRQYGRRYSPSMTMGGGGEKQQRQIGFHQGEDGEHLTREQAEEWVASMKGADGSKGGRWKFNEIRQYAQNFGISGEHKVVEFFAIINAMASDYGKVAKKFGVDKADFYAELAKAFMDDADANPGKAMIYYDCIVRKDDE